jgi:hypothetical protein
MPKQLKKFEFKKGDDPRRNLKGRPKRTSLKEYARKYLESMTEEERVEYLNGLDADLVWKMAEGNPQNKDEMKVEGGELPILVKFLDENNRDTK